MALSCDHGIPPIKEPQESCSGLRRGIVASLKKFHFWNKKTVCSTLTCLLSSELTLHQIGVKISIWEAEQLGLAGGCHVTSGAWDQCSRWHLRQRVACLFSFYHSQCRHPLPIAYNIFNVLRDGHRENEDTIIVSWGLEMAVDYETDLKSHLYQQGMKKICCIKSLLNSPFLGCGRQGKGRGAQTSLEHLEKIWLRRSPLIATRRSCLWVL